MNQDLYNHGIPTNRVIPVDPVNWVRNSEWLAMPSISPTENKIAILLRIDPGVSNYFAMTLQVTGGYTVDWGDGNVTNHATTTPAYKQYDYSAISAATTTSAGYRQVMVVATPTTAGNNLSVINLNVKHNQAGLPIYNNPGLDLLISAPAIASSILVGGGGSGLLSPFLERIQVIASACTSVSSLFYNCPALQSATFVTSATLVQTTSMFSGCSSLQIAPYVNLTSVTDCSSMFSGCYNLRSVPYNIVTAATNINSIFNNCYRLRSAPQITLTSSSSVNCASMFNSCFLLASFPRVNFEKANALNSAFSQCVNLREIPSLNLPVCTTLSSTFYACYGVERVGTLTTSNSLTNCSSAFLYCYNLVYGPTITNTSKVTTFSGCFQFCSSLISTPVYDLSSCTITSSMYASCLSLVEAPAFNMSTVTTAATMFQTCTALLKVPSYNFTSLLTANSFISSCPSLLEVGDMTFGITTGAANISFFLYNNSVLSKIGTINLPATATSLNASGLIQSCARLTSATIRCDAINSTANTASIVASSIALKSLLLNGLRFGGITIAAMLDKDALIALFTSLGTASGAQTITVSGNPGWASLTAADKLIATSKGWTLA